MIDKIKYFIEYFEYLDNPIGPLLFKFGLKNECTIKIKNTDKTFRLKTINALDRFMNKLPEASKNKYDELITFIKDVDEDKKIISIDEINYYNIYNTEFKNKHPENYNICNEEYFSDDQWDMLNISGRYIIDIGANVADTALYFAKYGATVIAFEPVKHLYDLGIENISLNPQLKDQITFINKAVGAKKGVINIANDTTKSYVNSIDNYDIEVITVQDVLNEYNFKADVLKMDCEGCEFEIILKTDLSMFNEIIFEHHAKIAGKDYKPLIIKLKENGFKIDTYDVKTSRQSFEDIGIIHAFK